MNNTDILTAEFTASGTPPRQWLYIAMWRWHFYAGLLSIPICMFLGTTGAIYLFKPFVEPLLYHDLQTVTAGDAKLPLTQQLEAAQSARPNAKVGSITPGTEPHAATEVSMRTSSGENILIYVNPYTGAVTGELIRSRMFMQQVRDLHGELMLGKFGTLCVELTACWTIVLLATGIYLWWPRPAFRLKGVFIPRLRQGSRLFWRDMHAVVAMYASAIVLVLLITGLPWTTVWGGLFKEFQSTTGQARPLAAEFQVPFKSVKPEGARPLSLEDVVNVAHVNGMANGYTIMLPRGPAGTYGFVNRNQKLEESDFLFINQYTADVISRAGWDDHPATAKAVALGIRLHQGELFGVANLILMLIGALAVIWMSFSAAVMWWRRRPSGKLGVPTRPADWSIPRGIAAIILLLAILLPLVGVSLIFVLLLEKVVLTRVPRVCEWLGLPTA
tara:strand:+ start:20113 stop:21444 length:1332 start_codon:yes stop_codon:yes gene_type:complete